MLDINSIIVPENRQRRAKREIDDQFVASVAKRLINPITLRHGEGSSSPILVAGERRLLGLKQAGLTELEHNIHYRFLEDLSEEEAEIVELEENVKRKDLEWRDHVAAVGRLHGILFRQKNLPADKIARELSISPGKLGRYLTVFRNTDSPNLRDATGIEQAYSILQGISERRIVSIVQDLAKTGQRIFDNREDGEDNEPRSSDTPSGPRGPDYPSASSLMAPNTSNAQPGEPSRDFNRNLVLRPTSDPSPAVLNEDFIKWASAYNGDKFTLIHCDFPYDVKYDSYARSISSVTDDYDFSGFWPLTDALCENIDKLMSYSSHLMFWFSMKFYCQTKERLEKAGLHVHDHPFIWHKTDNSGIIPGRDALFPRRTYETAFLATRGRRPLVRSLANIYGAPLQSNATHPSHKNEAMLRHFFGMLIDETTDVLDPTCGSGAALLAAEAAGARKIVGLELNPTYAEAANAAIANARVLRRVTT